MKRIKIIQLALVLASISWFRGNEFLRNQSFKVPQLCFLLFICPHWKGFWHGCIGFVFTGAISEVFGETRVPVSAIKCHICVSVIGGGYGEQNENRLLAHKSENSLHNCLHRLCYWEVCEMCEKMTVTLLRLFQTLGLLIAFWAIWRMTVIPAQTIKLENHQWESNFSFNKVF